MAVSLGGQEVFGCPISDFLSIEAACSVTNVPACATAAAPVFDAACCSSLTSFGSSLVNCVTQHPLTCLDTSALITSLASGNFGNPCTALVTTSSVGESSPTILTTSAAVPTSSSEPPALSNTAAPPTMTTPNSSSAANSASTANSGSATNSSPAANSGSSISSVNPSTSPATITSDAPKVGAGLEVYIGIALIGALTFLTM